MYISARPFEDTLHEWKIKYLLSLGLVFFFESMYIVRNREKELIWKIYLGIIYKYVYILLYSKQNIFVYSLGCKFRFHLPLLFFVIYRIEILFQFFVDILRFPYFFILYNCKLD